RSRQRARCRAPAEAHVDTADLELAEVTELVVDAHDRARDRITLDQLAESVRIVERIRRIQAVDVEAAVDDRAGLLHLDRVADLRLVPVDRTRDRRELRTLGRRTERDTERPCIAPLVLEVRVADDQPGAA